MNKTSPPQLFARLVTVAAVAADALAAVSVATAVGFLPALRDYDQYPTLATIRARTVVVSGGADPMTPAIHARDLAAGIPGAEHVHVPGAGHMLPQEAAAVVHHTPATFQPFLPGFSQVLLVTLRF